MLIYPKWKSLPIIPSKAAMNELSKYYMDLYDVAEILERGYNCAKSKRKPNTYEMALIKNRQQLRSL